MSINRARNSFGPRGVKTAGGVRRLIFTNNSGLNNNRFISGAEVGGLNSSVRQALKRRASSKNTNTSQ
jgi:hypothetical protein